MLVCALSPRGDDVNKPAAQEHLRSDGLKVHSEHRDWQGDPPERWSGIFGLVLIFLLVYLAALVTLFPVHRLWSWVEIHIPENQRPAMTALRGTPWRGEVQGLEIGGQGPGTLAWTVQPQALLRGRLSYALEYTLAARESESGTEYLQAKLGIGPGAIEIRDLSARLELARWNGFFDVPVLVDGRVEVESSRITLSHGFELQALDARIFWRNAALGFPQVAELGNYSAELREFEGGISASVNTAADAALGVEGELSWQPSGLVRVDLLLSPTEALALPLRNAVESLGRPDGQGRVQLRFEQRI